MANSEMEIGLDKEGQEVLAELEKEGYDIAGREKPAETPTEPVTPAQPAKVEPVTPTVQDPKTPVVTPPVVPDKTPAPDRKVQHVPLPKYLETENALKAANAKIEELSKNGAKPSEQKIDQAVDAVKKLVDDFGYDEAEAKKLADVIKAITPGQTLTAEQQQALADLETTRKDLDSQRENLKNEQDKIAFTNDFADSVLKDFPHLAEHKEEIKQMAYSEQYAKTPLRAIALAFMDAEGIAQKPVDVKTSERGGGGTGGMGGEEINFETLTDAQFDKMTPDQQQKFFDYQEAKEKTSRGALKPLI